MAREVVGAVSFWLIAATLKAWGRCWISAATSRRITTAIMGATIWLLSGRRPAHQEDSPR